MSFMKKMVLSLAASLAAVLMVTALVPSVHAEEPVASVQAPVVLSEPDSSTPEVKDPEPAPTCLPGTPLTCADLPSTPSSSCSCTSQLLQVKCKSCEGGKGQVLETTCTVTNACQNPPCDIQENYSRTGYSCAT
jgi:hypothetical protein